jgi:Fic family protein
MELGEPTRDVTAVEVLSNIDAMSTAISEIGPGDPISVTTLLTFPQRLLGNTRQAQHAGRLREKQNWIGGSDYSPCSAAFVPPPDTGATGRRPGWPAARPAWRLLTNGTVGY